MTGTKRAWRTHTLSSLCGSEVAQVLSAHSPLARAGHVALPGSKGASEGSSRVPSGQEIQALVSTSGVYGIYSCLFGGNSIVV